MTNEFFIGYLEKSKWYYRSYYPNYSPKIIETKNTIFIGNDEISMSGESWNVVIQEIQIEVPLLVAKVVVPSIIQQLGNVRKQ